MPVAFLDAQTAPVEGVLSTAGHSTPQKQHSLPQNLRKRTSLDQRAQSHMNRPFSVRRNAPSVMERSGQRNLPESGLLDQFPAPRMGLEGFGGLKLRFHRRDGGGLLGRSAHGCADQAPSDEDGIPRQLVFDGLRMDCGHDGIIQFYIAPHSPTLLHSVAPVSIDSLVEKKDRLHARAEVYDLHLHRPCF